MTQSGDLNTSIEIPSAVMVSHLAEIMDSDPIDVIKQLMRSGIMANLNEILDFETAAIVATNMGYKVRKPSYGSNKYESSKVNIDPANLVERSPVVAMLGHVDHGKTTLLDAIRNENVVDQEFGGITQHIGADRVEYEGNMITFLDTPGDKAFTNMRARGASATDVVVLVIAADDGVMPQTREAIDHAKAANVPIIVAANKMDLPDSNIDQIYRQISEHELLPEAWGGDTIVVPVSAKSREGVDTLLQNILALAELEELKADATGTASGIVIESRLDRSRGPLATLLVQHGEISVGSVIVAGTTYGKIKAMYGNDFKNIDLAGPSMPVLVLGLNQIPDAGDTFIVAENEQLARYTAEQKLTDDRFKAIASLGEMSNRIQSGEIKELFLIVKCDVQGSVDAIKNVLSELSSENVQLKILRIDAGSITDTDILLATASGAVIVGFNTRIEPGAEILSEQHKIEIRQYDVIYKLQEDLENAVQGLLQDGPKVVEDGYAVVRAIFPVGRRIKVAGCHVLDGVIRRNSTIRVTRDNQVLHEGPIASLKHFQNDVREVTSGLECGIVVEGYTDFQEDDVLQAFHIVDGS